MKNKINQLNLDELRNEINSVDKDILNLLAKRMDIVEAVAKYKIKHDTSIEDKSREYKLREFWYGNIKNQNVTREEIDLILNTIVKISKARQAEIKNKQ